METISSEDRKSQFDYFVFFDLDRTITGAVSGRELVLYAYKKGILGKSGLATAWFLSLAHKLGLISAQAAMQKAGRWITGMPVQELEILCSELFTNVLLPSVFRNAVEEIKFHREKNAGILILSSSIEPICRLMIEKLEMDDIICTKLISKNGILTGKPEGEFCYEKEKALRLRDYCEKNNSKMKEAWYYGDAVADIFVLEAVGNPVCVNPEKRLTRKALKRGWKILHWKN